MPEYYVVWTIELDADSAEDAARQARDIQLDEQSAATVFKVYNPDGSITRVEVD